MVMTYNQFRFARAVFLFLVIMDMFGDAISFYVPFLTPFNFLGSAASNTIEGVLFLGMVDTYYRGEFGKLLASIVVVVVVLLLVVFILGGLVI